MCGCVCKYVYLCDGGKQDAHAKPQYKGKIFEHNLRVDGNTAERYGWRMSGNVRQIFHINKNSHTNVFRPREKKNEEQKTHPVNEMRWNWDRGYQVQIKMTQRQ